MLQILTTVSMQLSNNAVLRACLFIPLVKNGQRLQLLKQGY